MWKEIVKRKLVEMSVGLALVMTLAPGAAQAAGVPSYAEIEKVEEHRESHNDIYIGAHSQLASAKLILDQHGKIGLESSINAGIFYLINPAIKYVDRLGDRGFLAGVMTDELEYDKFVMRGALYRGMGQDYKINLDYQVGYHMSESIAVQASYNLYEFDRGGKRHDFNVGLSYKF